MFILVQLSEIYLRTSNDTKVLQVVCSFYLLYVAATHMEVKRMKKRKQFLANNSLKTFLVSHASSDADFCLSS